MKSQRSVRSASIVALAVFLSFFTAAGKLQAQDNGGNGGAVVVNGSVGSEDVVETIEDPLKAVRRGVRYAKVADDKLNVKLNSLVLIGIVNPAVEFKVMKNFTVQMEAFGSFYTTDFLGTGKPFVLGAGFLEFRYYPRFAFSGFYVAPNVGFGVYKLNKGLVLRYTDQYKGDEYQQGSNVMAGLTIGYHWNIDEHWSIEFSWGGGFQQSVYQGFRRYSDDEPYVEYAGRNASAEWPPLYKGGIFVGYRF